MPRRRMRMWILATARARRLGAQCPPRRPGFRGSPVRSASCAEPPSREALALEFRKTASAPRESPEPRTHMRIRRFPTARRRPRREKGKRHCHEARGVFCFGFPYHLTSRQPSLRIRGSAFLNFISTSSPFWLSRPCRFCRFGKLDLRSMSGSFISLLGSPSAGLRGATGASARSAEAAASARSPNLRCIFLSSPARLQGSTRCGTARGTRRF